MRLSAVMIFAALLGLLFALDAQGASYGILVPQPASRTLKHAGEELAKYLKMMTGDQAEIGGHAGSATEAVFILGSVEAAHFGKGLFHTPTGWTKEASPDAYYLQSVERHGTHYILLAGKSDPAVLYAVYEYLQRYGDCGFFEDGDFVPHQTPRFAGVSYFSKPRFSFRHFRGDLCGGWGLKKFHYLHRNMGDWTQFYDWLAKRRMNASDFWPLINAESGGDAIEMTFGLKDETPGERYGAGWPTGYTWPSKVRTKMLQERLAYQRSLGIKSVIQVMFGLTPIPYKQAHPELKWVNGGYDHAMVSPEDPKAYELSKKFLQNVVDLYGTDHFYQDTPYSESLVTDNYDQSLKLKTEAAKLDCRIFKEVDPQAKWITDTWDFCALPAFWTAERRKTYYQSIPRDMCYVTDATTDMGPQYRASDFFQGLPWAVGNLHSYQGDDHLHGNLQGEINMVNDAVNDPRSDKLTGYVHLPEIHGQNMIYYQLSTELAWNPQGVTLDGFVSDYTLRRYGEASYETMLAAQKQINAGVYQGNGQIPIYKKIGSGFYNWCMPIWEENYTSGTNHIAGLPNTINCLKKGIDIALTRADAQKDNPLYGNDVVEWTKSYLGHIFNYSIVRSYQAFKAGDAAEVKKQSEYALRSLKLIQDILSTRQDYWLKTTVDAAMAVPGTNPATPKMIRKSCINDLYAANDCYEETYWFFYPRAEIYFSGLKDRMKSGQKTMTWADVSAAGDKVLNRWMDGPIDVPSDVAFQGTPIDACRHAMANTADILRDANAYEAAQKQKVTK